MNAINQEERARIEDANSSRSRNQAAAFRAAAKKSNNQEEQARIEELELQADENQARIEDEARERQEAQRARQVEQDASLTDEQIRQAWEKNRPSDEDYFTVMRAIDVNSSLARNAVATAFRAAMNDTFFRKDLARLNMLVKGLNKQGSSHFKTATIRAMFIFSGGFTSRTTKQGTEREYNKELSCLSFDAVTNEYAIKPTIDRDQWQKHLASYRDLQVIDFDALTAKEPAKLLDIEQLAKLAERFKNTSLVKATQKTDVQKVLNALSGVLPGFDYDVDAEQRCSMNKANIKGKPVR